MTHIALIGGGNMGYALALGIKKARPDDVLSVADPIPAQRKRFHVQGVHTTPSNIEAVRDAEIVILAVKPQIVDTVTAELRPVLQTQLIVSIVAGVPLTKLNRQLGKSTPIVRCMPNTPALIGKGITGMKANAYVSTTQRDLAALILSVCGEVLWLESDDDLDKVTALSGSGPAYFFYVIESLVAAGEAMGLSRDAAMKLVTQTAVGASAMTAQDGSDPRQLRANVTSPGGTTEAALNHLIAAQVDTEFIAAVNAAYRRAQELAA